MVSFGNYFPLDWGGSGNHWKNERDFKLFGGWMLGRGGNGNGW